MNVIQRIYQAIRNPDQATINQLVQEARQITYGRNQFYDTFGIQTNKPPTETKQKENFRGIFFRCITMRSNLISTGMEKFSVRRRTGQGDSEEVEESHPWVKLLSKPCWFIPTKWFYKWVAENQDLKGHADMVVKRDARGVPITLLPVFQEFGDVYPVPGEVGEVAGWVFFRHDGTKMEFPAEDVIRIGRTSPFSPWETVSLLKSALLDLEAEGTIKEFRRDSVKEGGITSPIITTEQPISRPQAEEFEERLREFLGRKGQGRVLTLGSGAKPMQQTSKELEAISGIAQTKDDLKEICGIPVGLFQKDTNRASAESVRFQFIENTINPELRDIASSLQHGMERAFGSEGLIIEVPDLSPLDDEQERKWREHLIGTGQRNINYFRQKDGEEEAQHGETYWISPALMPVDQAMKEPEPAPSEPEPPEENNNRKHDYSEEELVKLWRSIDRQKAYEKGVVRAIAAGMFEKWEEAIIKNIDQQTERGILKREVSTDSIIDVSRFAAMIDEDLTPAAMRALRRGFESAAGRMDLGLAFESAEVRTIVEQIIRNTKSVPETLKSELGGQVATALQEKKDPDSIKTIVKGFFSDRMGSKADTVAATIANGGFEGGQVQAYGKAGIKEKRWLSQRDGAVRFTHQEADGQVVGLNEKFIVGGVSLDFPGDPNGTVEEIANCRCTQLPVRNRN